VFLRQLEYLTALARERHFGRAAQACQVSQPALSVAIRKLEQELGVPLVHRHHRYDDLTSEGRALLRWAVQAQAGVDGLTAEAALLRGNLAGTVRLGVIPTALSLVSLMTGPLLECYPGIRVQIHSLSSSEIARRLADLELDGGITYLDDGPLADVEATPLYDERYVFLTKRNGEARGETITWSQLRDVPLCLLTTNMQNRRIVDRALQAAGVVAAPRAEADSITALVSFVHGGWSCVMAHTWLALQDPPPGMCTLELTHPTVTHQVGLVTRRAALHPPIVRALRETLTEIQIDAALGSDPVDATTLWHTARLPAKLPQAAEPASAPAL
jgi:DNA-binding transcriptional LysR family regulator